MLPRYQNIKVQTGVPIPTEIIKEVIKYIEVSSPPQIKEIFTTIVQVMPNEITTGYIADFSPFLHGILKSAETNGHINFISEVLI